MCFHTYKCIHRCNCVYINILIPMRVYTYIHMHIHIYIYIHMHIHIYIYASVDVCVYVYIYGRNPVSNIRPGSTYSSLTGGPGNGPLARSLVYCPALLHRAAVTLLQPEESHVQ